MNEIGIFSSVVTLRALVMTIVGVFVLASSAYGLMWERISDGSDRVNTVVEDISKVKGNINGIEEKLEQVNQKVDVMLNIMLTRNDNNGDRNE